MVILKLCHTRNASIFSFFLYRKNSSFISCWRSHRFKQRPHGGGHQFCGKMYCNSCEYLILNEHSAVIPPFALLLVTFAFAESGVLIYVLTYTSYDMLYASKSHCQNIFRVYPSAKKCLLNFIVLGT